MASHSGNQSLIIGLMAILTGLTLVVMLLGYFAIMQNPTPYMIGKPHVEESSSNVFERRESLVTQRLDPSTQRSDIEPSEQSEI